MKLFRLLFTILVFAPFVRLQAQSLSVEKFRLLENDLTANTRGTLKYDQNGDVAALIKVVTTENDFNFDVGSMGVVATTQQKGEIWVYVPGGVRRITITHAKLGVLRDYYFPIPIEKARTYELVLASGRLRTYVQDEVTAQYVIFKVTPQNAIVTIDNIPYGLQADGTVSQLLSYGTHSYRVDAPGFISESGAVEVGRERITRDVALKSAKGKVTLECSMTEAEIYLNGSLVGTGSWTGELNAAMYQVEVKRDGHTSRTTSFSLQPQDEKTISLPVPQPIYGTISVTSVPIGATVYIDNVEVGTTPLLKSEILVGHRKVEFRKQDYKTVFMDVEIEEGKLNSFSAELSDAFTATVSTQPGGASLQIDGNYLGQTPYVFETSSGDYQVNISKPGYAPYKKKIHLDASTPELNITLQRKMLSKTNVYLGATYQVTHAPCVEVFGGVYLAGFNTEGGYYKSYAQVKQVWWMDNTSAWSGDSNMEYSYSLESSMALHAGYGILAGNRLRLTPRVGLLFHQIKGWPVSSTNKGLNEQTYVVTGRVGLRTEYSPLPHFAFVLTPAYDIPFKMGSIAQKLDETTSLIKDWCSGFSFNVGLELYF